MNTFRLASERGVIQPFLNWGKTEKKDFWYFLSLKSTENPNVSITNYGEWESKGFIQYFQDDKLCGKTGCDAASGAAWQSA